MESSENTTVTSSCHCKAVRLTFPKPRDALNDCLCSTCQRYGTLWAYYHPKEVKIEGEPTDFYIWGEKRIEFHRCKKCGCVTHWAPVDENASEMGINCRMLEWQDLENYEVKKTPGPE